MNISDIMLDNGTPAIPDGRKWFDYRVPGGGGFRVLLNRRNPTDADKLTEEWMRTSIDGRRQEVDPKANIRVLAKKVVLDIEGLIDRDGKPIEATEQIKIMLLTELGNFWAFVMARFRDEDAFRKNAPSGPDSSGSGEAPATAEQPEIANA